MTEERYELKGKGVKKDKQLIGIAGVFYVCYRLSKDG